MSIQAIRAVTHPSSRSGGQSQCAVLADAVVGGIGTPDSAHMIRRAVFCVVMDAPMECSVVAGSIRNGSDIAVVG
ncbi:hypothetical protein FHT08_001897 [Xanthomonas campestris]|uniref:hypothetical protein n=1 Tax=Xanthomonas sp. CFBP 8151 TaxID=3035310 RepID=UPI00141BEFF4|nr:hypothetical protein [Xanthomonas sp. CFBP 8151]NIJ76814.1 hypothetical protein [Xanthomonas sp. CFBP 8151]